MTTIGFGPTRRRALRVGAGLLLLAAGPAARGGELDPQDLSTVAEFLACEGALAPSCARFRERAFEDAARGFRRLAERGVAGAENNLGILHETGLGADKSRSEALRWYERAARRGLALAQFNLGVLLAQDHVLGVAEEPDRIREDFIDAYAWLLVAARGGFEEADRARQDLLIRLTPEEVGEAKERAEDRIRALARAREDGPENDGDR